MARAPTLCVCIRTMVVPHTSSAAKANWNTMRQRYILRALGGFLGRAICYGFAPKDVARLVVDVLHPRVSICRMRRFISLQ